VRRGARGGRVEQHHRIDAAGERDAQARTRLQVSREGGRKRCIDRGNGIRGISPR